jgi:hypothetical protein
VTRRPLRSTLANWPTKQPPSVEGEAGSPVTVVALPGPEVVGKLLTAAGLLDRLPQSWTFGGSDLPAGEILAQVDSLIVTPGSNEP